MDALFDVGCCRGSYVTQGTDMLDFKRFLDLFSTLPSLSAGPHDQSCGFCVQLRAASFTMATDARETVQRMALENFLRAKDNISEVFSAPPQLSAALPS